MLKYDDYLSKALDDSGSNEESNMCSLIMRKNYKNSIKYKNFHWNVCNLCRFFRIYFTWPWLGSIKRKPQWSRDPAQEAICLHIWAKNSQVIHIIPNYPILLWPIKYLHTYFCAIIPPGSCVHIYPQKKLPRMIPCWTSSHSNSPSSDDPPAAGLELSPKSPEVWTGIGHAFSAENDLLLYV